jgi:iron complex transport system ATP-binding protein
MTVLAAHGITVSRGATRVMQNVSLALKSGELVGLLGPNAAGKSTLLRALAGLAPLDAGTIDLDGRPLADWPRARRAQRIAYLEQGARCAWPIAAARLVALGRLPHLEPWLRPAAEDVRAVETAMAECDVTHLADRPATELSGGEEARVLLARALAGTPAVILADEPIARLDPAHQLDIMAVLGGRARAGAAVLAALHDLNLAARCDRLIVIDKGRIAADGSPREVLTARLLRAVYGVNAILGERDGARYVVVESRVLPTQ